jgi:hypothetical protein
MAITTTISTKELERQAALAFEGETLKVMLCQVGLTGYTAESTVANWQSVEVSGNGYVRYSELIGTGSYSGTAGAYLLPTIDADFTATGAGYSYDRVVLYIDGATYPHSVIAEDPNITLLAGQTQTYRLDLQQDD